MNRTGEEWKKELQADFRWGSSKDMLLYYNDNADTYDKYMQDHDWEAPLHTAKAAAELYPSNRQNIRVLDVAAGTGVVALEMTKLGFKLMDALDPAPKMLEVSKKTGLYGRFICASVGNNKLDIENDTYDLITICAGLYVMSLSDIVAGMRELIRVTKPGANFVMVTSPWHFSFDDEPKTEMETAFGELEQEGLWQMIHKKKVQYISAQPGSLAVYRKT